VPTTPARLKQITGAEDADSELQIFCDLAIAVATENLSPKWGSGSFAILDIVENFIAAHFWVLSVERGGITFAKSGLSEERYKSYGYDVYGFMSTRFGQQACALDITGLLAQASQKQPLRFFLESYSAPRMLNVPLPIRNALGGP
jgi:hypothetical protein